MPKNNKIITEASKPYYVMYGYNKKFKTWDFVFGSFDKEDVIAEVEAYRDGSGDDEYSKVSYVTKVKSSSMEDINEHLKENPVKRMFKVRANVIESSEDIGSKRTNTLLLLKEAFNGYKM